MAEVYEYTIEWMPRGELIKGMDPIPTDEILLRRINAMLNERGKEGWEPVYFHPKPVKFLGKGITYPIILKRKKQ